MERRIEDIIQAVTELGEGLPRLDTDELESRLSDLETQARELCDVHIEALPSAVEALADAIHDLYGDV